MRFFLHGELSRVTLKRSSVFLVFLTLPALAFAGDYPERAYQEAWCDKNGGVMEYVLDDKARVDCLTDEYAIEFDFGKKWAESIGQVLYYGIKTEKKPGVVLILEKDGDERYLDRLKVVADKLEIRTWTMGPNDILN